MPSPSAFLPPTALPWRQAPTRRHASFPVCHTSPRRPGPPPRLAKRPLPSIAGAIAGALALVFSPFGAPAASAAAPPKPAPPAKELRYDGRQELDGGEKAMSLTLTAGTFAALGVWAWKLNRRDDELENIRIKEEVERLEKLKAEFMDVEEDDETMDDEDLLASLKQRIEDAEEDGEDGGDDEDGEGDVQKATDVVAERPADVTPDDSQSDALPDESAPDVATSDSVDMLKRMWDATDDDQKKDDKS